jgi:hypothetical protein
LLSHECPLSSCFSLSGNPGNNRATEKKREQLQEPIPGVNVKATSKRDIHRIEDKSTEQDGKECRPGTPGQRDEQDTEQQGGAREGAMEPELLLKQGPEQGESHKRQTGYVTNLGTSP